MAATPAQIEITITSPNGGRDGNKRTYDEHTPIWLVAGHWMNSWDLCHEWFRDCVFEIYARGSWTKELVDRYIREDIDFRVNGMYQDLDYVLQDGDFLEIFKRKPEVKLTDRKKSWFQRNPLWPYWGASGTTGTGSR